MSVEHDSSRGAKMLRAQKWTKQTCCRVAEPRLKKGKELSQTRPLPFQRQSSLKSLVIFLSHRPAKELWGCCCCCCCFFWRKLFTWKRYIEIFQENKIPQNWITTSNYDLSDLSRSRGRHSRGQRGELSHAEVLITPETLFSTYSSTHICFGLCGVAVMVLMGFYSATLTLSSHQPRWESTRRYFHRQR